MEIRSSRGGTWAEKTELGEERGVWALAHLLVSRPPTPVTMPGFGILSTLGKYLLCPRWSLPHPPGAVAGFLGWISSPLLPVHGGWTGLAKLCLACVWSQGTVMEILGAGCFGFVSCLFVTVSS